MSVWDMYEDRINASGKTNRERLLNQTKDNISRKIKDSLSYHYVSIDGVSQGITITDDSNDLSIKKICALPDEGLLHGGMVEYANSHWIITEVDANDEVYSKGKMQRCNYLLKWLDDTGSIIEKWSIVEDGTKYLIGEKSSDMMSIGDARIAITLPKDADTNKLCRGMRFLVDDNDADRVLAYQITKPNKLYNIYDGRGIFRFILNEVNLTDDDNVKLRIADYYNWKKPEEELSHKDQDITLSEIIDRSDNNYDKTSEGRWI